MKLRTTDASSTTARIVVNLYPLLVSLTSVNKEGCNTHVMVASNHFYNMSTNICIAFYEDHIMRVLSCHVCDAPSCSFVQIYVVAHV